MYKCPNCGAELANDAARCTSCAATFGADPAWKPLYSPSPPKRIFVVAGKIVTVLLSLAWLLWGGTVAWGEKSEGWVFANAAAAVLVIVVALTARTSWSGILMFACVALGFASCAANFHLNMR